MHVQLALAFHELPRVQPAMARQAQVDAVVTGEVLRLLRRRSRREIRWRADNRHPHVRADTHGDHVLRHLLAPSNPGVVTLGSDVGQAIVDDDLDLDVWILRQELREFRQQDRIGRILGRRDPNAAGRLVAKLAQGFQFSLDLLDVVTGGLEQTLASLRWRDAPRRASQQTKAQPCFEPAKRVTQR